MIKIGNMLKAWLPLIISISGLVTGYFVFKEETRHQFELQRIEMKAMQAQITILNEEIDENQRDWQRRIELSLQNLRETDIRTELQIKFLENRSN